MPNRQALTKLKSNTYDLEEEIKKKEGRQREGEGEGERELTCLCSCCFAKDFDRTVRTAMDEEGLIKTDKSTRAPRKYPRLERS